VCISAIEGGSGSGEAAAAVVSVGVVVVGSFFEKERETASSGEVGVDGELEERELPSGG